MTRQTTTKTILWAAAGMLAAATLARFVGGLGATTGLSDAAPWGFWIAFDVMAGVALAAGGFVVAGAVYIFNLEAFRPFVRPAVLTAFLGYAAVAVGLSYDLGLPWNIWHPIIFPQPHSVLFEVAMCVMLYLTVLLLEVSPAILEHPLFDRPWLRPIHDLLKRATIPLVIVGIVLSTLHQSSLGSLFLIAPHRVHPLWYSPIIWVLFFVSAVGLGLMMVTMESFFSAWYSGHALRIDLLARLGRAASVVLLLYAGLRLSDLAWRGVLLQHFDGSAFSILFLMELGVGALLPGILLAVPRARYHPRGLFIAALLTIFGIIGYRFNVSIVAFSRPEGMSYFPSWIEIRVSAGIVAVAMLIFLFFVDNLKIYSDDAAEHRAAHQNPAEQPAGTSTLLPVSIAAPRAYSLACILGFSVTAALLPLDEILGNEPMLSPVSRARLVGGSMLPRGEGMGHDIVVADATKLPYGGTQRVELLSIDGNRDGRLVLFPHDGHVARLGGNDACNTCHHQNMPYARGSACSECHRDMYATTDIFDHARHVRSLRGNEGCAQCHDARTAAKTRDTATQCLKCHQEMLSPGTTVGSSDKVLSGMAVGYMEAMHGLCIGCHEQNAQEAGDGVPHDHSLCTNCHRGLDDSFIEQAPPYALTGTAAAPSVEGAYGNTVASGLSQVPGRPAVGNGQRRRQ